MTEHPDIDIGEALRNPNLLGHALGDIGSWRTWLIALRAAYGLPLGRVQREIFATIAGGRKPPKERVRELWCIVGRRGGKSRVAAAIASHSATLQHHKLAPGERGFALVLSQTKDQATLVLDYARAFLEPSPVLRQQIVGISASEIRLRGNLAIAVHPNSFRSVRGRTLICAVLDETALWRDEDSALPDIEAYRAILPSLATTNGMLIGISTPYMRRGLLHQKFKDHYGHDDPDVLVLKGPSLAFNPTLSQTTIERAIVTDPEGMLAEWDAEFRNNLVAFLSEADIDAAIDHDRPTELPPQAGIAYCAFVDVSGGRHDRYALCVGHRDKDSGRVIADVVRAVGPPFNPRSVTEDYAALLRQYRLSAVTGDAYSGEWAVEAFAAAKIKYTRSEWPKSKLYLEALPAFTRGLVSLPDLKQMRRELLLLERRTHVGGKDSVDHGKGGSDDLANAVCGMIHLAQQKRPALRMGFVAAPYANGGSNHGYEVDPVTFRPLDAPERARVRWVRIPESEAPAAKGFG